MKFNRVTFTLEEVLDRILDHRGRTPKKLGGDFSERGVRVISAKNIKGGELDPSDGRYVSEEMFDRWMPEKLKPHDVLLTSEAPLGECALVPEDSRLCLGQRLFALRASPEMLEARYLYFALRSKCMQQRLQARASGTTATGIRQAELRKVEIDLPPLPEQRRIAWILGSLDDKIKLNRWIAKTLDEIAATNFGARFVDFVGVKEFEESEIGPIPKGWSLGCVGDLAEFVYGKALPSRSRRSGTALVVGSSGIIDSHDEALFRGPGVIVGRKGTAGKVNWVSGDFFPIDTTFVAIPQNGVGLAFLYYVLSNVGFEWHVSDSAVPGLNREAALSRPITFPPRTVIKQFEESVGPGIELAGHLRKESGTLTSLREALLPRLISGEIRLPGGLDAEWKGGVGFGSIAEDTTSVTGARKD